MTKGWLGYNLLKGIRKKKATPPIPVDSTHKCVAGTTYPAQTGPPRCQVQSSRPLSLCALSSLCI